MAQNQIIKTYFSMDTMNRRIETAATGKSYQELGVEIRVLAPQALEQNLNESFILKGSAIIAAAAFVQKVTTDADLCTLGPSLKKVRVPYYERLRTNEAKTKFRDHVNMLNRIYEDWPIIIENVCQEHLIYIDIRTLHYDELQRCNNAGWVQKYNDSKNPNKEPKMEERKLYTTRMVKDLVEVAKRSTLFRDVDYDKNQISMFLKDFSREIKKVKRN